MKRNISLKLADYGSQPLEHLFGKGKSEDSGATFSEGDKSDDPAF
jgi:hypothetical protein